MCKQTNKHLFVSGFGVSMLTYYCATNCAEIHVINGAQKGSAIEEITTVPEEILTRLTKGDVFLDYSSGDYYAYKQEVTEWQPEGNVSLHYTRKSTMLTSIANYLRKQKTYKPKSLPELYQIYRTRNDETVAYVKKQYNQHWLFEGVPMQYLVLHENDWEVHPVNLTQVHFVKHNYNTLVDSEKGPEICEHDNTIAMESNINIKYPESKTILLNYTRHTLIELFAKGRNDITIALAERLMNEVSGLIVLEDNRVVQKKRQMGYHLASKGKNSNPNKVDGDDENAKFTTCFAYSGLNYSKRRGFLVVKNNAVLGHAIKAGQSPRGKDSTVGSPSSHHRRITNKSSSSSLCKTKSKEDLKALLASKHPEEPPIIPSSSYDPTMIYKILHPNMPEDILSQITKKPETVFHSKKPYLFFYINQKIYKTS